MLIKSTYFCFFFQAEDGIRDYKVTGVQTCALPICGGCGGAASLGFCRRGEQRDEEWSVSSGWRWGRNTRCIWCGWATGRCWWRRRRPGVRWSKAFRAARLTARERRGGETGSRDGAGVGGGAAGERRGRTFLPSRHIGRKRLFGIERAHA